MISIGKKIQKIRKEKEYSQESLYPKNQAQVSLIESGKIKNPDEFIIRKIAENLDVSFDSLIEGTSWSSYRHNVSNKDGYAYSTTEYDVELDNLSFKVIPKSYPLYDKNGDKNEFCPTTGTKLISECVKCGKSFDNINQKFCMSCGAPTNPISYFYIIQNYLNEIKQQISIEVINDFDQLKELVRLLKGPRSPKSYKWFSTQTFYLSDFKINSPDTYNLEYTSHSSAVREYFSQFEHYVAQKDFGKQKWTFEEWEKGIHSENPYIKEQWELFYVSYKINSKIIDLLQEILINLSEEYYENKSESIQKAAQNIPSIPQNIEQYHIYQLLKLEKELGLWEIVPHSGYCYWEEPIGDGVEPRKPEDLNKLIQKHNNAIFELSKSKSDIKPKANSKKEKNKKSDKKGEK